MMRAAVRTGALLLLLHTTELLHTDARSVSVNLAASWPSSPLFPLLETSEYLAEENPAFFWQFVERLKPQTAAIAATAGDVDALAELAVQEALHIAPASKSILELMLATRTYSVKVEMYRQLGLDSGVRVCSADTDTWAVLYSQPRCVEAVACSASELDAALLAPAPATSNGTCVATGEHDIATDTTDHTFPHTASTRAARTAILYGAIGTQTFYAFHDALAAAATQHGVQYVVRPFAPNATLETRLQGYGVALDIKNMEYKTIDDSTTSTELADAGDDLADDDDDDEDVDGLLFHTLATRHNVLADTLKQFRDSRVHADAQTDAQPQVKAWHLKDVGLVAARAVLAAARPLQKLQTLAQDFPKHAARLAFARTPVTETFRAEAERRRTEAVHADVLNKFFVNGIAVDPTQRSFNIFDFMATLKAEWSVAKQLTALPLTAEARADMLTHVREARGADQVVRIRVRGPVDGTAPFYLNDITSDPTTRQWPRDIEQLRRPAWNIVFVRRNMYESVVVVDPVASAGRLALQQIAFMRMRGAPIQWALLVSSHELLTARTHAARDALVATYKAAALDDRATAWHFAKLLFLARAKDNALAEIGDGGSARSMGRVVASFIEGVADESVSDVSVQHLVTSYTDGAFGLESRATLQAEALDVLRNATFDDAVLSMTEFIEAKHLPFESSLFNGVLRNDVDLQRDLMTHLGRDQALYQTLARTDALPDDADADLIEELLASQETYPSYFPIFDTASSSAADAAVSKAPASLLAHDVDASIETLLEQHVAYLHAPQSLLFAKKQTLLLCADLGDAVHAAHAYHTIKAVLEDSDRALRIGVVPQLHNNGYDDKANVNTNAMRQLVTAIVAAVGTSDVEAHLRFVLDVLDCVVRGKSVVAARDKLRGILERLERDDALPDPNVRATLQQIVSADDDAASAAADSALPVATREGLEQLSMALQSASAEAASSSAARLYINGYPVDLPASAITDDDVAALTRFDAKYRSHAVARAFVSKSPVHSVAAANAASLLVVKACDLVDRYARTPRTAGLDDLDASELVVRLPGDAALQVTAYLDPLSEATQMISSLLLMLHRQLNASVEVVLLPAADYAELPLQRFYRYLFDTTASLATSSVEFRGLPIKPILTMKLETPEAWNVQVHRTLEDLDNLRVDATSASDVRATKTASFRLESLLVYGQCRDKTFDMYTPPHGLQLVLQRDVGGATRLHRDTLVMRNLGYFQLQATPGVWSLQLARGRASDLFEIVDVESDAAVRATPVRVADFGSHVTQLVVRKRPGREHDDLLDPAALQAAAAQGNVEPIAADAGRTVGSYLGSMVSSLLGKSKSKDNDPSKTLPTETTTTAVAELQVNRGRSGETIHVFSLASGHLYERFLKIMMSSVLKRTRNPVTFWLLENFLSPAFKESIPALRAAFGMDIRLVTYKWPNWLRQQTQKQRIIWGYKILFLDVLFPLGVQKIIYVDADQVVRADLKELWDMDLDGAPYGYTPFCDARNVGFQFWREGYWKDHLRGRPYHISALYVVDLALFRQMAAGDALRATYDQLSADPNSLANLDQDLPNYTQHQIRIFSLPREWLWCDSWCSDDSKAQAKTIDLCNNPKHKEPKLEMAKRVISGDLFPESWVELDQEIKDAEAAYAARVAAAVA